MIKKIKTRNKKIKIGRTRKMRGGWQCSYNYPICKNDGWCYNVDGKHSAEDIEGNNNIFFWNEKCSENNTQLKEEAAKQEQEAAKQEQEAAKREQEAAQLKAAQQEQEAAQRERKREAAKQEQEAKEAKEAKETKINETLTSINRSYVGHSPRIDKIEECINDFKTNIRSKTSNYDTDCIKKNFTQNCVLGEGGFGKVIFYRCDESNVIAFKIHKENIAEAKSTAIQEISILQTLTTLYNVINLYKAFDTTTGLYVISYEAINGYNLTKYISDYKDTKYKNEILYQLIYTMLDIHTSNILHLDIKPDNIMIDITKNPHRAVYIDFGLSVIVPKDKFEIIDGNPDDNFIYNQQGTLDYVAPSIINNFDKYTNKTKYNGLVDLWALGITIAYMYMTNFNFKITSRPFDLRELKNGEIGKIVNDDMKNIFRYQTDNTFWSNFPDNTFWSNFINYDKFKDLYLNLNGYYLNLNRYYKGALKFENIPSPPAAWSYIPIGNPINAIRKKGVAGIIRGLIRGGKYRKSFKRKKPKKRKLNKKSIRKKEKNPKKEN